MFLVRLLRLSSSLFLFARLDASLPVTLETASVSFGADVHNGGKVKGATWPLCNTWPHTTILGRQALALPILPKMATAETEAFHFCSRCLRRRLLLALCGEAYWQASSFGVLKLSQYQDFVSLRLIDDVHASTNCCYIATYNLAYMLNCGR